jgi:hypothetical protein
MFGLTKREQRWKAEQQAAELIVGFAQSTVRAAADVRVAESHAELETFRASHKTIQEHGFRNAGELLASYKHLAQQENAARRRIDELVAELTRRDAAGVEVAPLAADPQRNEGASDERQA